MRRALPEGYEPTESYELSGWEFVGLNLMAVALAAGTLTGLARFDDHVAVEGVATAPERLLSWAVAAGVNGWAGALAVVAFLMLAMLPVILLHEAIHGLALWAFTRSAPLIGFRGSFAYCGQRPGTFLSRNQFLVVAFAPVVLLTLAGFALLSVAPAALVPLLKVVLVVHSAGCAADVWGSAWLLTRSPDTFVWNGGLGAILYSPAE